MMKESARERSFESIVWPHANTALTPARLAAAGFYAAATQKAPDRVVCFACENALTNWDPTDDPWQEHQTWYPQCPLVQGRSTGNLTKAKEAKLFKNQQQQQQRQKPEREHIGPSKKDGGGDASGKERGLELLSGLTGATKGLNSYLQTLGAAGVGAGSSKDARRKAKPKEDEGKGAKRNALPNFPIVQDMRKAIKQEGEELAEESKSHYLSVRGSNSIETLERQDDRLEINQRENQNLLKVQLDSSEECEEHIDHIVSTLMQEGQQQDDKKDEKGSKEREPDKKDGSDRSGDRDEGGNE